MNSPDTSPDSQPIRNNVIIRVAAQEDMDGLARLNNIFNEIEEGAEAIWRRLSHPRCAEIPIVAVFDDRIVGFAGLRVVPHIFYPGAHAEVTELFVDAPYRRRGIATALMRFAQEIAQESNATEIVLHTGEDNHAAQAFYAAMGYETWELVLGRPLSP